MVRELKKEFKNIESENSDLAPNKVREGNGIRSIDLRQELFTRYSEMVLNMNVLITIKRRGGEAIQDYKFLQLLSIPYAHDYTLSMLKVAELLDISRPTCSDWVIPQLDRIKIDNTMRYWYAKKHSLSTCKLQE